MGKEEKQSHSKENTKLGEIKDELCDSGSTKEIMDFFGLLTSSKTHNQSFVTICHLSFVSK